MKRQRKRQWMKEHGKNLQDQTNKEERVNLPEKVFRVMAVKMMQDLRKRVEAQIKKTQVMV